MSFKGLWRARLVLVREVLSVVASDIGVPGMNRWQGRMRVPPGEWRPGVVRLRTLRWRLMWRRKFLEAMPGGIRLQYRLYRVTINDPLPEDERHRRT